MAIEDVGWLWEYFIARRRHQMMKLENGWALSILFALTSQWSSSLYGLQNRAWGGPRGRPFET